MRLRRLDHRLESQQSSHASDEPQMGAELQVSRRKILDRESREDKAEISKRTLTDYLCERKGYTDQ